MKYMEALKELKEGKRVACANYPGKYVGLIEGRPFIVERGGLVAGSFAPTGADRLAEDWEVVTSKEKKLRQNYGGTEMGIEEAREYSRGIMKARERVARGDADEQTAELAKK